MGMTCEVLRAEAARQGLEADQALAAFTHCLEWLRPVLAEYLLETTGPWEPDELAEVLDRTVAAIVEVLESGGDIRAIVGFARRVAYVQAVKFRRAEARQTRIVEALAAAPTLSAYGHSAEEVLISREEAQAHRQRLALLRQVVGEIEDPTNRRIYELRLEGLALKEIAPQVTLSLSAARARYWRQQEKLRARIEELEAELPVCLGFRLE